MICLPVKLHGSDGAPARAILRPITSRSPGENVKAVAVFPGSRAGQIIEQEVPRLTQPDQVMLRLLDVGICGTDKEICTFEYGTPPPGMTTW